MAQTTGHDKLDDQKGIIIGRVEKLLEKLRAGLDEADSFDKTLEPVKDFYITVCAEFPAYVRKVMFSNPDPCPGNQIWCLPKMRCTDPGDCNNERIG